MAKKKRVTLEECKKALRWHIMDKVGSQKLFAEKLNIHPQTVTKVLGKNNYKPSEAMLDDMGWIEDPVSFSEK